MHRSRAKRVLSWTGTSLSVLSIIFLASKLIDYSSELDFHSVIQNLVPFSALVCIYAVAGLFLAAAWICILKYLGFRSNCTGAIRIYGVSQLAKYIPGNIFHFVGRQAIGVNLGMPGWTLAKSMFWEVLVMVIAGGLFFTLLLFTYFDQVSFNYSLVTYVVSLVLTICILLQWFSKELAFALILDSFFLWVTGLIFFVALSIIDPEIRLEFSSVVIICGAYVVSWLMGFVTPGAPAGIGIREVVLLSILGGFLSEASLLSGIVIARIITVLGDLVFCLYSFFLRKRTTRFSQS